MCAHLPNESELAARVLVIDSADRILLLQAQHPDGRQFWLMPGGRLRVGERFDAAAIREVYEETGLNVTIGPHIWTRRHIFTWNDVQQDQYEQYFVAFTHESDITPIQPDGYMVGHRWWTFDELAQSNEEFTPNALVNLLPPILRRNYPDPPIDCGI